MIIPAKIEMLIVTLLEGRPVMNAENRRRTVNGAAVSTFPFVTEVLDISGISVTSVVFLSEKAQ